MELDKLLDIALVDIAKCVEETNRMSYAEFGQFLPLFKHEMYAKLSESERGTMVSEWYGRIDCYHPVRITGASGEVLFTLPATFTRVDSIDNLGDEGDQNIGTQLLTNLQHKIASATPVCDESAYAAMLVQQAITTAADNKRIAAEVIATKRIIADLRSQKILSGESSADEVTDNGSIDDYLVWD